jgi:hypothetical protein
MQRARLFPKFPKKMSQPKSSSSTTGASHTTTTTIATTGTSTSTIVSSSSSSSSNSSGRISNANPTETILKQRKNIQVMVDMFDQMLDQVNQVRYNTTRLFNATRSYSQGATPEALSVKISPYLKNSKYALQNLQLLYSQHCSVLDNLIKVYDASVSANDLSNLKNIQKGALAFTVRADETFSHYENTPILKLLSESEEMDTEMHSSGNNSKKRIRENETEMDQNLLIVKMSQIDRENALNKKQRTGKSLYNVSKRQLLMNELAFLSQMNPKWSGNPDELATWLSNLISNINCYWSSSSNRAVLKFLGLYYLSNSTISKNVSCPKVIHVQVGEGTFHAFITVTDKYLEPIRIQIFGMDERKTIETDALNSDVKKEQYLSLQPLEQSQHHVYRMVSRCAVDAMRFYQENRRIYRSQLRCLLIYLFFYEKIFMEKCVICDRLLQLDSEEHGFIPPMRSFISGQPIHIKCVENML